MGKPLGVAEGGCLHYGDMQLVLCFDLLWLHDECEQKTTMEIVCA